MGLERRLILLAGIAVLAVGFLFARFEMLVPLWGTLRSPYLRTPATKAAHKAEAAQRRLGAGDALFLAGGEVRGAGHLDLTDLARDERGVTLPVLETAAVAH